jgi:hypothetical protein
MNWLAGLVVPSWAKYLIGYFLILLAIFGSTWGVYHCGVSDERERQLGIENAKVAEYGQQLLDLQTKNRELERDSVINVNELTMNYEKRINDAETKTKSALRNVATGALKLRIATKNSTQACGDIAAEAGTPATAVTESTAELSTEAAGFLINLTSECDATVEKLNLCIDIATSDRKEILSNDTLNNELDD